MQPLVPTISPSIRAPTTSTSRPGTNDAPEAPHGCAGGHLLAALVSGKAALDIEEMSDDAVVERVMHRLRTYHPDCSIPDPVAAVVTQWGKDKHTLGSYSSVPPGSTGADDYKEMAKNVDGRLFFAGEATSFRYPAQMHGAYASGLREVCSSLSHLHTCCAFAVLTSAPEANRARSDECIHIRRCRRTTGWSRM